DPGWLTGYRRYSQRNARPSRASDPGVFGAYRGWVGHIGHQGIRRNLAEQPGLEVLHGPPQFGPGIHHKGSICRDRFADGPATQDQKLQGRTSRVWAAITADLEPAAAAEYHQLTIMYRSGLGTDAP